MKVIALIPARGGSKGIKSKNIVQIAGFPLIAYSIIAAHLTKGVGRTVVSTDSKHVAAIACAFGADLPFMRPAKYATDKSTDKDWLTHALHELHVKGGYIPDLVVHLRPTTPLREPKLVERAIKVMKTTPYDSLRSAHEIDESPYKMFGIQKLGLYEGKKKRVVDTFKPYINTMEYDDPTNLPRQTFPPCYAPNGFVDILRPDIVLAGRSIHGEDIGAFITPYALEIDTLNNLAMLELYFQGAGKESVIYSHLLKHYGHLQGKLGVPYQSKGVA